MKVLIITMVFVVCLGVIEGLYYAFRNYSQTSRLKDRLNRLSADGRGAVQQSLMKRRVLSEIPWLHSILVHIPGVLKLDSNLEKANIKQPIGIFLLLSVFLLICGYLGTFLAVGGRMLESELFSLIVALLLSALPFLHIVLQKRQRMAKLERQLPDALDTISRALRAGHAFSTGLKLVAEEFDDPIGTEFEKTFAEINFGVSVVDALTNLTKRVDCPDMNYFVVSVIIQRETGGNLAEILESIGYLIRERFKFRGKVRVLAAEARMSAYVLMALPFFMLLLLQFLNPGYTASLMTDHLGRMMVLTASIMMFLGFIVMKKMVNIDV